MAGAAAHAAQISLTIINEPLFAVGQSVQVAPRTMPGFNYEGGSGRITEVHCMADALKRPKSRRPRTFPATSKYVYDVTFIMRAATERSVDVRWISPSPHRAEELAPLGHDPPAARRTSLRQRAS